MKLKYIKLAGFKSFADSTVLEFPDSITAVVGPNGCGKSNIVDAIRWVLGETSRHIRGETLDDVVFQGTGSRKPQGLASVEIVFDNSDGSLEGRYSTYSEISIRRTTNRERESKYYLNGARCRRRDITDLLQGTGLTGNKYAIIEQGMMANLVDAKPEELRGHIEEAAGVARYKERRREAESNMRRTRENLDRVLDIRDEVAKQLRKLKTQVRDAERFVALKNEKKQRETEINLLKKRDLTGKITQMERDLSSARAEVEKAQAGLLHAEARIKEINDNMLGGGVALDQVKEKIYALNATISNIENDIRNRRESEAQLLAEQGELKNKLREAKENLQEWQTKRAALSEKHARLAEELEVVKTQVADTKTQLAEHTGKNEDIANRMQLRHRETSDADGSVEVEKTKIALLNSEAERLQATERELRENKQQASCDELEAEARAREAALRECDSAIETAAAELREIDKAIEDTTQATQAEERALHDARKREHELQGRLESLRALQEQMLRRNEAGRRAWLKSNNLAADRQLVSDMQVDKKWEAAGEAVLESFFDAIVVPSLDQYAESYAQFDEGVLTVVEQGAARDESADTLLSKVSSSADLGDVLGGARLADSLASALSRRQELRAGETFVTPDGARVGRHWVRLYKPSRGQEGVFARRQEMQGLKRELDAQKKANDEITAQLATMRQRILDKEERRKDMYDEIAALREKSAAAKAEKEHFEKLLRHEREARAKLQRQLDVIEARLAEIAEARGRCEEILAQAQAQSQNIDERYGDIESERAQHSAQTKTYNERLDEAHDKLRRLEVDSETARSGSENAAEHIAQLQRQIEEMNERAARVTADVNKVGASPDDKSKDLNGLLENKAQLEKQRQEAEAEMKNWHDALGNQEARRREAQQIVDAAREKQSAARVNLQVAQAQAKELDELLDGVEAPTPDENVTMEDSVAALEATQKRIDRLGAINLAAVEEHEELSERKKYLDAQNDDLVSAMASLKKSIKKIDDESERRFTETLDKINEHLKTVFPQLFGGGQAELKMIGDDVLNDGVVVSVRPPGKRSTVIHLMSGGEKALTSAAVLLSIFELRPAPFCVLDEVDAPLDDQNVDRFCALLRKMSERVQLIMVTHNKISMEYADAMIGVTMREAGVTRPVSVNIDEAVKMVAV